MRAIYYDGNSEYDAVKLFFVRERAEAFMREVNGFMASELETGGVVMYEVRYLRGDA